MCEERVNSSITQFIYIRRISINCFTVKFLELFIKEIEVTNKPAGISFNNLSNVFQATMAVEIILSDMPWNPWSLMDPAEETRGTS